MNLANKVAPLPEGNRKEPTRRQPKKVPSYHLTSPKSMQFIKEADDREKIKEEKDRKTELVKKEAVKNLRKNERKTKTKMKKKLPT